MPRSRSPHPPVWTNPSNIAILPACRKTFGRGFWMWLTDSVWVETQRTFSDLYFLHNLLLVFTSSICYSHKLTYELSTVHNPQNTICFSFIVPKENVSHAVKKQVKGFTLSNDRLCYTNTVSREFVTESRNLLISIHGHEFLFFVSISTTFSLTCFKVPVNRKLR